MANKKKALSKPAPQAGERPQGAFPIVGIGASAGGLAAFEAFFSGMPGSRDPGMAFVLVQHLAPDHKSILSELIQRYTRMQVFEVADGMVVQPNCAYIIPPNRDMAYFNGSLQLLEPSSPRGQRLPIDFFFSSLAQDLKGLAIGIILSGTGSDGSQGVRAIKGEGGMVMAQSPESTEYDGMPRSAIATGLVDYILPAVEMPARLVAYTDHAFGTLTQQHQLSPAQDENGLKKIFLLLRAQTGHDFSQYKPNTIQRRIERRLAVHQIDTIQEYGRYLQQAPAEVEALFRDLLIGVTSFFRDPEVFQALEEQVIPKLFAGKSSGEVIRVWSAGCATGEEAYSLAILLVERMEILKRGFVIQVFATDIDSQAIATARAGLYPASIGADISPERLARFFSAEPDGRGYRICKSLRDMLIFSEQDVIRDPPFSRLDLISCRNLLIYLRGELQKKLIPLFHYALNPGGFMLLGTSETVGKFPGLFAALDHKRKLYRRKEELNGGKRVALGRFLPPLPELAAPHLAALGRGRTTGQVSLRELTEQMLLRHLALAAVLVNARGDIFYLHGRSGRYLEPTPGEAGVNNVLKMAREGLRYELTAVLHKAVTTSSACKQPGLRVKTNGDYSTVNLTVLPVTSVAAAITTLALYLIVLDETSALEPVGTVPLTVAVERPESLPPRFDGGVTGAEIIATADLAGPAADASVVALQEELRVKQEYLEAANEELETSNEELQSVNEELATVNAELQAKVIDLSRANNDMNNLLAGTGIATIFVDHDLRILRFTPAATQIINLILSDVGRPVAHIVNNLVGYDSLLADVQGVLDSLVPRELEVQTREGSWYSMHIRPYRTLENVIEGAVVTFADITATKKAREVLQNTEGLRRLAVVVRDSYDGVISHDLDGRILAWNPRAEQLYGWSEAEALAMNIRDLLPEEQRCVSPASFRKMGRKPVLQPQKVARLTKDGRVLEVLVVTSALVDSQGETYAYATTEKEIVD